MSGREGTPNLEVCRLTAPDGLPVGFIAWDFATVTKTTPIRTWSRSSSTVVATLHTRVVMLSGEFAGDYDDFYEPIEGRPEMYSGTFAYRGTRFRCEELHGADADAVINEHFEDWP